MDKKIAGLLGAAAALTTVTAANAAVSTQPPSLAPAASYRDLLDAVPNPTTALKLDDARLAAMPADQAGVKLAQFYHHHHHHHHFVPPIVHRFFRYHHHHHQVFIVR